MTRHAPSVWRRIGALSPGITLVVAIMVTLLTLAWMVWRYGWL
jgi:hypothetical protein